MLCPHSAAAQVKYLATGYGASILNASGEAVKNLVSMEFKTS